jgi:hypothetical protein
VIGTRAAGNGRAQLLPEILRQCRRDQASRQGPVQKFPFFAREGLGTGGKLTGMDQTTVRWLLAREISFLAEGDYPFG